MSLSKLILHFSNTFFSSAFETNTQNIFSLLEKNRNAKLCDLGCDDGELTIKLANIVGTIYAGGGRSC
jgi:ubiquinone/menaquinone biosynthesis C-methylase UbiE